MTVLRVLDFETTALNPEDGVIIEVGYSDYNAETKAISAPVSWLCGADVIPPENRAVHHIRLEDVSSVDPFGPDDKHEIIGGVDAIVAHNADFEISFLGDVTVPVVCTYKSALRVWPNAPSHSNAALAYWLEDEGKVSLDHTKTTPTHRAGPDAYITAHILKALFESGATGRDMVAWTKEPKVFPKITFGKHKGTEWKDAPMSYLTWMLGSDMDEDFKWNARREIERRNGGKS